MSVPRLMQTIGVWQMAGGAISAVTFLEAASAASGRNHVALALVLAALAAALGSVLAGYGLYRGHAGALGPSLVVQGLQLIGFNLGTTVYQLTLGPYFYLTMLWGQKFAFQVGFMPNFMLRWAVPPGESTGVAINLLACWCFWKILWTEPHQMRAASQTADASGTAAAPAASSEPSAPTA